MRPPVAPARSPRDRSLASSLCPGGRLSAEIATKSDRLPLFSAISAEPAAPSRIRITASAARAGRRSRLLGRRFGPPADRPAARAPWEGTGPPGGGPGPAPPPGRRGGGSAPPADRPAARAPWEGVRVEDERLTRLP